MRCSAAATHASTCAAGSGQPVESVESHLWPNLTGAQLSSYSRSSILTTSLELLYYPLATYAHTYYGYTYYEQELLHSAALLKRVPLQSLTHDGPEAVRP